MKMMSKKRLAQGTVVALSLAAMTTVGVVSPKVSVNTSLATGYRTAGIVNTVSSIEAKAYANAEVQEADVTVVAKSSDSAKYPEWEKKLMANVDEFLYVRAAADANSEIVGKLRKGDVADVASEENGWYQVSSGNVLGFASADYCVVGDEAYELANSVCTTYATAKEGGVRVRLSADTEGGILTVMAQGDTLEVDTQPQAVEGWVAVKSEGTVGYVSADLVDVSLNTGKGITVQEEQEAIAAAKAKEEAERAKAVTVQNAAVAASVDDTTLLAALIQCEAGNEGFDGQVAVGAVVVNRMRSGGYPGSISGVVYQGGQFTPAASGKVAAVAASGPSASCMQAAAAALAGTDNTGGALSFRPVSSGRGGVVIGNHVFF